MSERPRRERILIVDDSLETLEILERNLTAAGYEAITSPSAQGALDRLGSSPFDLVITDLRMPGVSGLELVRFVRENLPDTAVMMITGYATIEGAVEAVKTGAEEYLAKPFTDDELFAAVGRALQKLETRRGALGAARGRFGLVGESVAMRRAFAAMDKAVRHSGPVLILGESGTGRWSAARAIAAHRGRPASPLLQYECGDLRSAPGLGSADPPEATTAVYARNLETAGPDARQGLLRILVEHPTAPLFFPASPDLPVIVEGRMFPAEIFERISSCVVAMPPLRERGDDIVLLAEHFTARLSAAAYREPPRLTDPVIRALRSYAWPGNLDELRAVVTATLLRSKGDRIDPADLPRVILEAASGPVDVSLADAEAEHILRVLAHTEGKKGRAAEILGIDRKTLREKLKALGRDKQGDD